MPKKIIWTEGDQPGHQGAPFGPVVLDLIQRGQTEYELQISSYDRRKPESVCHWTGYIDAAGIEAAKVQVPDIIRKWWRDYKYQVEKALEE